MGSDAYWNMEILIYDGYNHKINGGGGVIGTIVPQNSRWGLTNGYKIIEIDGEDKDQGSDREGLRRGR